MGNVAAETIKMDFVAYFHSGSPAVQSISGTIKWQADSPTAYIQSLTSIDLTILGHTYTLDEVGFINGHPESQPTRIVVGGNEGGVNSAAGGTNDFFVYWDKDDPGATVQCAYSTVDPNGAWSTNDCQLTIAVDNGTTDPEYVILGFFPPVAMDGSWTSLRAGATVPLRFQLLDAFEQPVSDGQLIERFTLQQISCETREPLDGPIDLLSSYRLRYNMQDQQFALNWKTPNYPGTTCWSVSLAADDDEVTAYFRLATPTKGKK